MPSHFTINSFEHPYQQCFDSLMVMFNLRGNPDQVAEAQQYPPTEQSLRSVSLLGYSILRPEQSTKELICLEFAVEIEDLAKLIQKINEVQSFLIHHHNIQGKVILSIDTQKIELERISRSWHVESSESSRTQAIAVYWEYTQLNYLPALSDNQKV